MAVARKIVRTLLPRPIRNVVRAPLRSAWWVAAELRHAAGLDAQLTLREGFSFRSHPAAYRLAYWAQESDQEQREEFDRFIQECTPGMRLFDLGAHFGLFTVAALHYGGSRATAVAVDPSPAAVRMLREQTRINGLTDRVTLLCAAAGAAEGWVDLVATGAGGAGYFVPSAKDHAASDRTRTPVTTIDALAARHGLPTHVKVDVESFEADVLRGGRETFTCARPPRLFLEVHTDLARERGIRPDEVMDLVEEYGYETFDLAGRPRTRADVLSTGLTRIVCLPARATA